MGKQLAKSKGNTARRANQRNNGLPHGLVRVKGSNHNTLPEGAALNMLVNAGSLHAFERSRRLLRRWGVRHG